MDKREETQMVAGGAPDDRVLFLDGWRGMAICMVIASHFFGIPAVDIGRLGVDVFFALSGMLMGNILFIKKTALKVFFIRRASRILPLVFVYVLFWYAFDYFFQVSKNDEYKNVLYTLTFFRSYFPADESIWGTGLPVGHFWSLNVEEHAYIVLGLVAALFTCGKKAGLVTLGLGGASLAIHLMYTVFPETGPVGWGLQTQNIVYFIFLSAGYRLFRDKFERFVHPSFPIIALCIAIGCRGNLFPWYISNAITAIALAFAVNHLQNLPKFVLKMLEARWLRQLGLWSFSIYIWQQPVFVFFLKSEQPMYEWRYALGLSCILLGYISFRLIETPSRRYLVNRFAPRSGAVKEH